jgi:hypothetical protein
LVIAKDFTQVLDMEAQIALFDSHPPPDSVEKHPVGDNLTGTLAKDDKKVESPEAETHGFPLSLQPPFCGVEAEGAECQHGVRFVRHFQIFKRPRSPATD